MIGRADIEGSKSNVAMNAWLPQASYPCASNSRSKGSIGHAFTVRIRTGNQNQTSFYPFVPHEISVLVELILGHLRYLLTDVPPQPNSPPDNVFRPDRPAEACLCSKKRGSAPPPIHGIIGFPLSVPVLSRLFDARGRPPEGPFPVRPRRRPASPRSSSSSPPTADGFGTGTPCPALRANPFPRLRIHFADFPCLHCSIDQRLFGPCGYEYDRGRHSVLRIFKAAGHRTTRRAVLFQPLDPTSG
ncbi:hypothetical protein FNV43_RR20614 [Rhamnella rubrinervis]|uniref:Senescence-associated protein n=1 Tax=Rhamnella rubrinervis TaxID=2594499 RepID=A0A8K0DZ34_9ROSA|nr:hypothetical protein FNV43_RR20614 [Rhamnella rubrinervis]